MNSFASTAGTVTSTLNAALGTANAIHNLLGWAANPHTIVTQPNRTRNVLSRRTLPPLTGGSDILDFSDMDD